jgi:hypothetical protein
MKRFEINFLIFLIIISPALMISACGQSAKLEVVSLDIKPKEVAAGETVTIVATIQNSGSAAGR